MSKLSPELIVLVGIPGSGKSTWAKNYMEKCSCNTIYLSSDNIREEVLGDINDQSNNELVFSTMKQRAVNALNNGMNVIYDATNISRKSRKAILDVVPSFTYKVCKVIWADIKVCKKRNKARERVVPEHVIERMLRSYQPPFYDEGFDKIDIVWEQGFNCMKYTLKMSSSMDIKQDNPHHQFTVRQHCILSQELFEKEVLDVSSEPCTAEQADISFALRHHDIGKPYTKKFENRKGEKTDIAHYYGHQGVGAWICHGMTCHVLAAWLIGVHMDPYLDTKYYHNLPNVYKQYVDIVHKYDALAH